MGLFHRHEVAIPSYDDSLTTFSNETRQVMYRQRNRTHAIGLDRLQGYVNAEESCAFDWSNAVFIHARTIPIEPNGRVIHVGILAERERERARESNG